MGEELRERAKGIVLAQVQARREAGPLPPGRRALEAQARAKRAEIRRLTRELFPPPPPPKVEPSRALSQDEQIEALRSAVAAKKSGDTRPAKTLIVEAVSAVREKRPPPPRER